MCKRPVARAPVDRSDANAFLEHEVLRLVRKAQKSADNDDEAKVDPAIALAAHPQLYGSVVRAGTPIYVPRSRIPVACASALALGIIGRSLVETGPVVFAFCLLAALAGYDLLSGFLHIVFDDTRNLGLPILGQPCLEFQMHHHFPQDLVRRNFLDVLGDLNTVVSLLTVWNLYLLDLNNPVARYMGGLKLLMAYYGQFSHRAAHDPRCRRRPVVRALRACGLLIAEETHRSHHTPPHDRDFCLVGACNPLINFLYHGVTKNRWFWMVGFAALGLGGIAGEAAVVERLLRAAGLVSF